MSRRSLLASLGALAVSACAGPLGRDPGDDAGPDDRPVALVGGRVLELGAGRVTTPSTVVVEGERIVAVEQGDAAPSGARVIDLAGRTLLPAFIDTHVHVQFAEAADVLRGGVATVRDLGSPPRARDGYGTPQLRLLAAGRILTPPGGYPTRSWGADGSGREVADVDDAAVAVAEQADEGASVIKVALEDSGDRPLFAPDVLAAVVAAAGAAGLPVTAHVGSRLALARALDAGVDELAHLPLYDIEPVEVAAIADAGITVIPTLAIREDDRGPEVLRAFLAAGGRIVYGTDLGNAGTAPGIMPSELRALAQAGLAPPDVLAAATTHAAAHLGLGDAGDVAAGMRADLVAVDGDPLSDLDAYERIEVVVAGGQVVVERV